MKNGGLILECYCCLRNVQDFLAVGKTPYNRRFGEPLKGPVIPFGAMVECYPICTRPVQAPPICQERFTWTVLRICLDCLEILERRYSDCRHTRIGKDGCIRNLSPKNWCERSLDITKGRRIHIPNCRWYSKIVGERKRIPGTHSKAGSEDLSGELQGEPEGPQRASSNDDAGKTIGLFKVTWFIVITMNLEFNSMCPTKKHSIFHWNRSMLRESLTQIWIGCKQSELMTTEMSMKTQVCLILGKDSQNSPYWRRHVQKDICGPEETDNNSNDNSTR